MTQLRVTGLDHVVLNVADVERSLAWYRDKLGLRTERETEWRAGEAAFLSLRIDATTVIDLFTGDREGENVDHVSLRVGPEVDLEAVAASGEFDVIAHPVEIWGAGGYGLGLYVRDPDGNTIELKHYEDPDEEDAS
jgi:catechol 2,3-dioxygenase-like lactoylglutathione lyase family enzyme